MSSSSEDFQLKKSAWALMGTTWRKVTVIEKTDGNDGAHLISETPKKEGAVYWCLFNLGEGILGRKLFTPGTNLLADTEAGRLVIEAAVRAGKATWNKDEVAPSMTEQESDYPIYDSSGTRTLRSKKSFMCMPCH